MRYTVFSSKREKISSLKCAELSHYSHPDKNNTQRAELNIPQASTAMLHNSSSDETRATFKFCQAARNEWVDDSLSFTCMYVWCTNLN